jgi:hypothetical protein
MPFVPLRSSRLWRPRAVIAVMAAVKPELPPTRIAPARIKLEKKQ